VTAYITGLLIHPTALKARASAKNARLPCNSVTQTIDQGVPGETLKQKQ
tara:strand:- start:570 stop:716 length:147 start_codon:yes stop_codon:yes gene_type:complete